MKPLTIFIASIHLIYIVVLMWLGPFIIFYYTINKKCNQFKAMMLWILIIFSQVIHWYIPFMSKECILAYLEKKSEDPNYVKGSEPNKSYAIFLLQNLLFNYFSTESMIQFHRIINKVSLYFAIVMLTINNNCIPGYVLQKIILFVILTTISTWYTLHEFKYKNHLLIK
jgi:hypothetical protein